MSDPNIQYRESDTEILQKRARVWLETVLEEKFDVQRNLTELLADGSILFRVAKHLTKELTGQSPGPEVISPKSFSESSLHGKSSSKYLPYSHVDAFLKVCRKMGLNDVDLFTPPDAVEGKDLRRVCVCIRALTRKARANHVRVPDFDDVTRPLPMPTERVGEIRDYLQSASNSPLSTSGTLASTAELDIQKSEKAQIIKNFLASTISPSSNISDLDSPVSISTPKTPTSTYAGLDSANFISPYTPSLSFTTPTPVKWPMNESYQAKPFKFSAEDSRSASTPIESSKGLPQISSEGPMNLLNSKSTSGSFQSSNLNSEEVVLPPEEKAVLLNSRGLPGSLQPLNLDSTEVSLPKVVEQAESVDPKEVSGRFQSLNLESVAPALPSGGASGNFQSLNSKWPLRNFQSSKSNAEDTRVSVHRETFIFKAPLSVDSGEGKLFGSRAPGKLLSPSSKGASGKLRTSSTVCSEHSGSPFESEKEQYLSRSRRPSSGEEKIIITVPTTAATSSRSQRHRSSNTAEGPLKATVGERAPSRTRILSEGPTRDPVRKAQAGVPKKRSEGIGIKTWLPIVAVVVAFLGSLLATRSRETSVYEVQKGDTLTKISKRTGNL